MYYYAIISKKGNFPEEGIKEEEKRERERAGNVTELEALLISVAAILMRN